MVLCNAYCLFVVPSSRQVSPVCSQQAMEQSKALLRNSTKSKLDAAMDAECQILMDRWPSAECHRAFRTYLDDEQDLLV